MAENVTTRTLTSRFLHEFQALREHAKFPMEMQNHVVACGREEYWNAELLSTAFTTQDGQLGINKWIIKIKRITHLCDCDMNTDH